MKLNKILENRNDRVVILCSVPVVVVLALLLCLCIRPLSVYVYNCYFELLALAVGWFFLWVLVFIWKRLSDAHPINRVIILFVIVATMLVSYPYAKQITKGRYVFYKYGLYDIPREDVDRIKSAVVAFEYKNWDVVKKHLDSCSLSSQEFFSYSIATMRDRVGLVNTSKENFAKIIENREMNPSVLALYASMAEDFGGEFKEEFLKTKMSIKREIDNIESLYKAIRNKDLVLCKELVCRHGHFWFEHEVQEMILNDENSITTLEQIVMKDDDGQQFKKSLEYAWGL